MPLIFTKYIHSLSAPTECRLRGFFLPLLFWMVTGMCKYTAVHAQRLNSEGNINQLNAGTNAEAATGDSLYRDLLPFVMTSSNGGGVDVDQQPYQVGVIAVRPSYVELISGQLAPLYQRPSDLVGNTSNPSSAFRYGPTALAQTLTVDPDDMEIGSMTLLTFRGLNFNKPTLDLRLDYDTNSSNVSGQSVDPSLYQSSSIRIPFTYGTVPGDSAFLMRLDYKPTHRILLSGPGGNETNHDMLFQTGKDLGRFAFALNNQATLSSLPIRELSGRNRVFSNRTSLRAAYDIAPKSFIIAELGHTLTTRTLPNNLAISGTSNKESIIEDDFQATYNYQLTPKWLLTPEFNITRTQFENSVFWIESPNLQLAYFATPKLIFTVLGGLQFIDNENDPTTISNVYGIEMDYIIRPKTVLELDLTSEIRPSFVNQGVFLREDTISLGLEEALLLRWLISLDLNYTLRTQDDFFTSIGMDQTDVGIELMVTYSLTRKSRFEFSVNRYQLQDKKTDLLNKRLNLQIAYIQNF